MLVVPLLALSLTGCGTDRPAIVLPPQERFDPVPFPIVPAGEAICDDGKPCLSDGQVATLLADFAKTLDDANGKIQWLGVWAKALR